MSLGNIGAYSPPLSWLNNGWHSLREYAHNAITHFTHPDGDSEGDASGDQGGRSNAARWGIIAVDVVEHKNDVEARFEVPGLNKEDLSIDLVDGHLSVTGEKRMSSKREEGNCLITERAFGQFRRSIPIPSNIDADRTHATYADGVLTITMPKTGKGAASVSIN
jgi:HSP20 family protein